MAATFQAKLATSTGPSYANAETGVSYNLADNQTDTTTPINIPASTGTNYSWIKYLGLHVTATGTTSVNNRKVSMGSAPATGLTMDWKDVPIGSYGQATGVNRPAAGGTNGAVPATYTGMTTTPALYDNNTVATSSSGLNGDLIATVAGVDATYVGGAGTAIALPNVVITFDEF